MASSPSMPLALASVTILYRHVAGSVEVFWVRRADHLAFMGGFWAFPGGRVEPSDASPAATAARELEEETGVRVPVERAVFAGRTVAPQWAPIRFDARYFLIEAREGENPDTSRSGGELVAGEWTTPAAALAAWAKGERLTSPVVVHALRALLPGVEGAASRLADAFAQESNASRLWEIAPGLEVAALRSPTLLPATHTNCFVVGGGGDDVVVIDPGSPYPDEIAALDAALAGRKVREIWLTHHHFDHYAGAAYLAERTGAPIAAHSGTADVLRGQAKIARLIADGEVARFGDQALRAVFTPGHTVGHLCFLDERTEFLLAGDMVAGTGTIVIDPDEGDMADYVASLAKMKALTPRALLPAHGNILADPPTRLELYLRHRLWREGRVLEALRAGPATPSELTPRAYGDVGPEVYPLAERSLIAHLVKLVREGRVRIVDGRYELV